MYNSSKLFYSGQAKIKEIRTAIYTFLPGLPLYFLIQIPVYINNLLQHICTFANQNKLLPICMLKGFSNVYV